MAGPKNVGISPEVVTGVLRSPGCGSEQGADSSAAQPVAAGTGLPPLSMLELVPRNKQGSKLSTLKWWAAAAASVNKNVE